MSVFKARWEGIQESRPRCVVVVYRRSNRGGLLERTSHRFIAVAATKGRGGGGACQDAKMLGQQSHNPLVCVSDEGAFGSVLFQGGVSLVLIKTDQINQRNQIGSSFLLRLGGSVFDLFFFLQVKADIVL